MKELIEQYSSNRIEVKFDIIESNIPDRIRNRLGRSLLIFSVFCSFYLLILFSNKFENSFLTMLGFLTPMIFVHFFDRLYFNKFKKVGQVFFLADKLNVDFKDGSIPKSIDYSQVDRIEYKGNLPKGFVKLRGVIYKSYYVTFKFNMDKKFTLHLYEYNFLDEKDQSNFRREDLHLINVLNHVPTKFGTEKID